MYACICVTVHVFVNVFICMDVGLCMHVCLCAYQPRFIVRPVCQFGALSTVASKIISPTLFHVGIDSVVTTSSIIHVRMRVRMCVCVCVCVCVCRCVCIVVSIM